MRAGNQQSKNQSVEGEISIVQSIQLGLLLSLGSVTSNEANKSTMRRAEWTITARQLGKWCSILPKWSIDILSQNAGAASKMRFFQVQAIKTGHISKYIDNLVIYCRIPARALQQLSDMNKFFLPTSRKVLTTFQTFCPVGVHMAQTVVHFAHFQVQGLQARKRGVLGWALGRFVYVHIPERGVWRLSKEQGLVVVVWANWDPILAKWDPTGQFVPKMGKSALELRKKNFQSSKWQMNISR